MDRQRSLVGYSPWGCKESDTTEGLTLSFQPSGAKILCILILSLFRVYHQGGCGRWLKAGALLPPWIPSWLTTVTAVVWWLDHWVDSLHQVAKLLELQLQLQHQSFQWIFRIDLGLTGLISLQSKGLSRVFFSTTIRKQQFFGIQSSLWSNFML